MTHRDLTDAELVNALRRCAGIWFKNSDLLLLEELIRRFEARAPKPRNSPSTEARRGPI